MKRDDAEGTQQPGVYGHAGGVFGDVPVTNAVVVADDDAWFWM